MRIRKRLEAFQHPLVYPCEWKKLKLYQSRRVQVKFLSEEKGESMVKSSTMAAKIINLLEKIIKLNEKRWAGSTTNMVIQIILDMHGEIITFVDHFT